MFISQEKIYEELRNKIEEFFNQECDGKNILFNYSWYEKNKIMQIVKNNKLEFDL